MKKGGGGQRSFMQKATHCLKWADKKTLDGSGRWCTGNPKRPKIHHRYRLRRPPRDERHVALTGVCRGRCVGICFAAISRCCSKTLVWLTS